MQNNNFIGIDIGLSGGLTLINKDKQIIDCRPMPTIDVMMGKARKIRQQYDIPGINAIIKEWLNLYQVSVAGFERLRAIPKQSSQTAFSMGGGAMLFKTLFTVWSIPYVEIEPRAWQQKIFGQLGIQYKADTTKKASIQAAKQLFPSQCFLANERCRTDHDGMTDSACIALFMAQMS